MCKDSFGVKNKQKNLSKHRLNLETRGGRRWKSLEPVSQSSIVCVLVGALELSAKQKSPPISVVSQRFAAKSVESLFARLHFH